LGDGLDVSYDRHEGIYAASIRVSRWENCREQGYVLSMDSVDRKKQLNIAFFEHRNTDGICAVKWEQITLNSPTINTAEFGEVYKDKYDTSYDVNSNDAVKLALWMLDQFHQFWG